MPVDLAALLDITPDDADLRRIESYLGQWRKDAWALELFVLALTARGRALPLAPFVLSDSALGPLSDAGVYAANVYRASTGGRRSHAPFCEDSFKDPCSWERFSLAEWVDLQRQLAGGDRRINPPCFYCGGYAIRLLNDACLKYAKAVVEDYERANPGVTWPSRKPRKKRSMKRERVRRASKVGADNLQELRDTIEIFGGLWVTAAGRQWERVRNKKARYSERLTDAIFLVSCVRKLLQVAELADDVYQGIDGNAASAAHEHLIGKHPHLISVRNMTEHFDDYLLGAGRLQRKAVVSEPLRMKLETRGGHYFLTLTGLGEKMSINLKGALNGAIDLWFSLDTAESIAIEYEDGLPFIDARSQRTELTLLQVTAPKDFAVEGIAEPIDGAGSIKLVGTAEVFAVFKVDGVIKFHETQLLSLVLSVDNVHAIMQPLWEKLPADDGDFFGIPYSGVEVQRPDFSQSGDYQYAIARVDCQEWADVTCVSEVCVRRPGVVYVYAAKLYGGLTGSQFGVMQPGENVLWVILEVSLLSEFLTVLDSRREGLRQNCSVAPILVGDPRFREYPYWRDAYLRDE
jgi:hypothetical protein